MSTFGSKADISLAPTNSIYGYPLKSHNQVAYFAG